MDSDLLWDKTISVLSSTQAELKTKTGLWFKGYVENQRLFIDRAVEHSPSSKVTKPRSITKNDFLMVMSYYDRWVNGEIGIRHEVSRKSRNTAYIFALIENFNS